MVPPPLPKKKKTVSSHLKVCHNMNQLTSYLGRAGGQMFTGTLYWYTFTKIDFGHQFKGKEGKVTADWKMLHAKEKLSLGRKLFFKWKNKLWSGVEPQNNVNIVSPEHWCCLLIISTAKMFLYVAILIATYDFKTIKTVKTILLLKLFGLWILNHSS